jgi:hypothetical protein
VSSIIEVVATTNRHHGGEAEPFTDIQSQIGRSDQGYHYRVSYADTKSGTPKLYDPDAPWSKPHPTQSDAEKTAQTDIAKRVTNDELAWQAEKQDRAETAVFLRKNPDILRQPIREPADDERASTMDVSTAKAEIKHGKQDLQMAKQDRAEGDLLQQTLAIGRQVQGEQKQPAESATKTRRQQP